MEALPENQCFAVLNAPRTVGDRAFQCPSSSFRQQRPVSENGVENPHSYGRQENDDQPVDGMGYSIFRQIQCFCVFYE